MCPGREDVHLEMGDLACDRKSENDPEKNPDVETLTPVDDQRLKIDPEIGRDHGTVRDPDSWAGLGLLLDRVGDLDCDRFDSNGRCQKTYRRC